MTNENLPLTASSCETPVISVLMAAYNSEAFIAEALTSLQRQTVSNIEIVIVNDGSTDGTLGLLESMARDDRRLRVINSSVNHGSVAARNLGLAYCQAPFIAVMDHDDIALKDRLEKQLAYLTQYPRIAVVGGMTSSIDVHGNPIELTGDIPLPTTQAAINRCLLLGPPCFHIWMARKEVYDALSGYRELFPTDDYDFLLRAVTSGYRLGNIPDVIMKTRISPEQSSNRLALQQRKLHHYVIELYRERMAGKADSFSPEAASAATRVSNVAVVLHRAAGRYVARGFASRRKLSKLFYLAVGTLISPWQARYFLDRFRMRLICRSAPNIGT